jgi:hypothetical protein
LLSFILGDQHRLLDMMRYLRVSSFLKFGPGLLKIQINVLGEDGRYGVIDFEWNQSRWMACS